MANVTGSETHGGCTNEKVSGPGGKFTVNTPYGRDNSATKFPDEMGKDFVQGSPYGDDPHFKGK
jgi:hypothetical protein